MIATDPGTITTIQGFGFSSRKPGSFQMRNKKSILWELEYCELFDVRHSIDNMHIKKNVCESFCNSLESVPITKSLCGPTKTAILGDWLLLLVTVVVE